jgi:hypothetical protein
MLGMLHAGHIFHVLWRQGRGFARSDEPGADYGRALNEISSSLIHFLSPETELRSFL